jgi:preprotein translocase subunit YajC
VTLETLFLFAPSGQGGGGLSIFLIQMMAIIAIFYFLIIRPKSQQEKKHKARLAQLKKGDKVVTVGGIIGEIVHIKDNQLTIRSGESRLVVQRERIADLVTGESQ